MRAAVHHEALQALLSGSHPVHISAAVLGGSVSTTIGILAKYQATLGTNAYFQNWFSSAQQHRKLRIHLPSEAPPLVQSADPNSDEYATASYFAGGSIVATASISTQLKSALRNNGTELLYIENNNFDTSRGDNPFLTINLLPDGTQSFGFLERFITPEDEITVYDKFINNDSLDLLAFIASKLSAGASLHIFHSTQTGRNLLNSTAIRAHLTTTNPSIIINCKTCPPSFTKKYHDRFIFFGNRFQIRLTAGLDCFGPIDTTTGNRINRESDLIFRDTSASGTLEILATDGTTHSVKFHGS